MENFRRIGCEVEGEKKKKDERKFQSGRDEDGRRGLAAECAKCTTTNFKF
jgi:hypothetical protein